MEMKILSTGANASGYSSMITMNGKKCLINAGDRYNRITQLFSITLP
jgi:hypothetical protein